MLHRQKHLSKSCQETSSCMCGLIFSRPLCQTKFLFLLHAMHIAVIPLLPRTSTLIFNSHSPGLKCHRGHHTDKHDVEDGVCELHGAFERQDQHAWHCLHSDHCDWTCGKKQKRNNRYQHKNICRVTCRHNAFLINPLSVTVLKECLIRTYSMTLPDEKSYKWSAKAFRKSAWERKKA